MADVSPCPTCRIVQTVCFWGPYKVASWKRPALLILSILITGGLLALASFVIALPNTTWLWFLVVPVLAFGVLGVVVALRGCLNCVSHIFGGI
jgi:hypothetical protein